MGNKLYENLIEEINENGEAKVLTVVSNNENFGKRIVINKGSTDEFFKTIINEIDLNSGTSLYKIGNEEVFFEDIAGKPKLIICGGGHIALPLSIMGKMLEFEVVVIDNRKEFANMERFCHVDRVICEDFEEALNKENVNGNTYIVIVTRGHKDDKKCLKKVLRTNHKYLGMIGSRGKVAITFNSLKEEGYTQEELDTVYSPIGLKIGAQTPEEISVSIFAEIIKVKNEKLWCNIEDKILNKISSEKEDMVLATIIEKKGSSPRGIGAKMLVLKDGSFIGTVGGGSVENAVYEKAKELIKLKKSHVESYNLSNSKASTLGMICGGTVRVFFEYIKVQ